MTHPIYVMARRPGAGVPAGKNREGVALGRSGANARGARRHPGDCRGARFHPAAETRAHLWQGECESVSQQAVSNSK